MYIVDDSWPNLESVSYPTFESALHSTFPQDAIDVLAWCKLGKIGTGEIAERWAYGDATLHVVGIRVTPFGESEVRTMLPVWSLKGRSTIDTPFVPVAANLLCALIRVHRQIGQASNRSWYQRLFLLDGLCHRAGERPAERAQPVSCCKYFWQIRPWLPLSWMMPVACTK